MQVARVLKQISSTTVVMSVRRRNTIHDLSSLRLHPDGSRVHNISRSKDSDEAAGVSTRLAKYTTRDAQGRWIAYDAGGLVTVKQRTRQKDARVRQTRSSDAEMRSDEDEMPFAGPSQVSRWKASATDNNSDEENMEDLEGYIKNSKAQKRMKFYHDYSFLEDPQLELRISAGQVTPALIDDEFPSLGINFPVPSSVRASNVFFSYHLISMIRNYLKASTTSPAITIRRRGGSIMLRH